MTAERATLADEIERLGLLYREANAVKGDGYTTADEWCRAALPFLRACADNLPAIIAALRAPAPALAEDAGGWRSMDSAPRDGTPILALKDLNDGSYEHVVVWWSRRYAEYPWSAGSFDAYPTDRLAYWRLPEPPPQDPQP